MSDVHGMRWQVRQTRRVEYDLVNVDDVFDPCNDALLSMGRTRQGRRFVVVDACVYEHHGQRLRDYFAHHGIHALIVPFLGGEAGKTMQAWQGLLHTLDGFPIHRRDEPIIAIGGGVLTDVVGFVASSYRRGIPHIKVPTTLMGYVDASVGIKTGINFNDCKNRVGSFEPPARVLLDRRLLATLEPRHLRNGMCEIIKLAVIKDPVLFQQLELSGKADMDAAFQDPRSGQILDRAIDGMLQELAPNLYEHELARKVDFGHTFSQGLETHFGDRLLHGEAVLLDILVSTAIACRRGVLAERDAARILALVERLGIVPAIELLDVELMWQSLQDRVEHRNGQQQVPLPAAIGACVFANDITRAELAASIPTLERWTSQEHEQIAKC